MIRLRTDLAVEEISEDSIESSKIINDIALSKVILDEEKAKEYNKKPGMYYTLDYTELLLDESMQEHVRNSLCEVLEEVFSNMGIKNNASILVCGLGNKDVTPDALGPNVCDDVIVTNHFFSLNIEHDFLKPIATLVPRVMGKSGMESSDIIKAVVDSYQPDLVIVIDALATRNINRICRSIQITDVGINPGSGVKNKRKEISKEVLNTNVIAIGIPTVCDMEIIINDCLTNFLEVDENKYPALSKAFRELHDEHIADIFTDILQENYDYMVTFKEIDDLIINLSKIISLALNKVLLKI